MQTFVVKPSSGVAAFVASITLGALKLSSAAVKDEDKVVDFSKNVDLAQRSGLRMVMTVIPILVLIVAFVWFKAKYKLNDEKVLELAEQVTKLHENEKQADA
jgi:melibiose permease